MQFFFSLGLLVASLAYTVYGLVTLDLVDSIGRPGPGYFPLIIGVLLILTTSYKSVKTLKTMNSAEAFDQEETYLTDTLVTIGLICLFLVTLKFLGAILSMVLFVGAFLAYFNRGRTVFNIIYSLVLPIAVYLLFNVALRAGLPKGLLD